MRIVIAALVSLVLSALAGRLLIPVLRRMKAGQSIKEDGPTWHMSKQGTPTMGGLMFIFGILATLVLIGAPDLLGGTTGPSLSSSSPWSLGSSGIWTTTRR